MKNDLLRFEPTLILLDTTHQTNSNLYKLLVFVYVCTTTGGTRVAGLAFLINETNDSVSSVLQSFHRLHSKVDYFMVDKDFDQNDLLMKYFPKATLLLCIFHVLKYIHDVIATIQSDSNVDLQCLKQNLFDSFYGMCMSFTLDHFQLNLRKWRRFEDGVTVKIGSNRKSLKDYIEKNWLACSEQWTLYSRRKLPILFTTTTNRIERLFGTMKKAISQQFRSVPSLAQLMPFILWWLQRRRNDQHFKVKIPRPHHLASDYEEAKKELSPFGFHLLQCSLKSLQTNKTKMKLLPHDQGETLEVDGKRFNTTTTSCDCAFKTSSSAPCSHIFFYRESFKLPPYEKNLFHVNYHNDFITAVTEVSNQPEPLDEPNSLESFTTSIEMTYNKLRFDSQASDLEPEPKKKKSKKEQRFCQAFTLLINTASFASNFGGAEFASYIDSFRTLEKLVRHGSKFKIVSDDTCTVEQTASTKASPVPTAIESAISTEESSVPTAIESAISIEESSVPTAIESAIPIEESSVPTAESAILGISSLLTDKQLKQMMIPGSWLGDEVIDAALKLFRFKAGILSQTCVASAVGFDPVNYQDVQIHNLGDYHWFATSTINGFVEVFDSMMPTVKPLPRQYSVQLFEKYGNAYAKNGILTVRFIKVQQQNNSFDCGVFAIAFLMEILTHTDPARKHFTSTSQEMRNHLHDLLTLKKYESFPGSTKRGPSTAPIIVTIDEFELKNQLVSFKSNVTIEEGANRKQKGRPKMKNNPKTFNKK